MNNEWKHIDESSLLISPENKRHGNYFKGHVLTFFSKQKKEEKKTKDNRSKLKFCLLEITTLLDATATGEIYLLSHYDDTKALKIKEQYEAIISKVQLNFNNVGVSSFKNWYCKRASLYIGYNPQSEFRESAEYEYSWNFDGRQQKEDKPREGYATREGDIEDKFIKQYLDYYIELLNTELDFSQHKHYAVIVKPLSLKYEDEIMPIGNLYLHFATHEAYTEDDYMRFLNEFTAIYLKEKGGRIVKELEVKYKEKAASLPDHEPNFHSLFEKNKYFNDVKIKINTTFKNEEFLKTFNEKQTQLKFEMQGVLTPLGIFEKDNLTKKEGKTCPLIITLVKKQKNISPKNIASSNDSEKVLHFMLIRDLLLSLLLVYGYKPNEIHSYFNHKGLYGSSVDTKAIYLFFQKFLIHIKESLTTKIFVHTPFNFNSKDIVDDITLGLTASKYEKAFMDELRQSMKNSE